MPHSDDELEVLAGSLRVEKARLLTALAAVEGKLDLLHDLIGGHGAGSNGSLGNHSAERSLQPHLDMHPDITLLEACREALLKQTRPFTKKDIVEQIQRSHPTLPFNPLSIETPFYSLVHEGLITTHRKKRGRAPAIYRRTDMP